jgi:hypothetical protein
MKARTFQQSLAIAIGLTLLTCGAFAQSASTNLPAPALAYGVADIVKLAQAKMSDSVIISFMKYKGNSYSLEADQIIYLRQQGVSDGVINAMLNQPRVSATPTVATAPTQVDVPAQPTVTYVQSVPIASYSYYSEPVYYPVYSGSYCYYGWPYYTQASVCYGGYYGRSWHGNGGCYVSGGWRGYGNWNASGGLHRGGGTLQGAGGYHGNGGAWQGSGEYRGSGVAWHGGGGGIHGGGGHFVAHR